MVSYSPKKPYYFSPIITYDFCKFHRNKIRFWIKYKAGRPFLVYWKIRFAEIICPLKQEDNFRSKVFVGSKVKFTPAKLETKFTQNLWLSNCIEVCLKRFAWKNKMLYFLCLKDLFIFHKLLCIANILPVFGWAVSVNVSQSVGIRLLKPLDKRKDKITIN